MAYQRKPNIFDSFTARSEEDKESLSRFLNGYYQSIEFYYNGNGTVVYMDILDWNGQGYRLLEGPTIVTETEPSGRVVGISNAYSALPDDPNYEPYREE